MDDIRQSAALLLPDQHVQVARHDHPSEQLISGPGALEERPFDNAGDGRVAQQAFAVTGVERRCYASTINRVAFVSTRRCTAVGSARS